MIENFLSSDEMSVCNWCSYISGIYDKIKNIVSDEKSTVFDAYFSGAITYDCLQDKLDESDKEIKLLVNTIREYFVVLDEHLADVKKRKKTEIDLSDIEL